MITRPISGSAIGDAEADDGRAGDHAEETNPSMRAWLPSAIRAGLSSRRPARRRHLRGDLVADESDHPRGSEHPQVGEVALGG